MKFTGIRDLKYITDNNSMIDLLVTCEEYGEMPMTLNLVDTEDIHTFMKSDGSEVPLEEYCKTKTITPYVRPEPLPEPLPEPIPEPIPKVISMRQARLQLLEVGLLDDVEALVSRDRKWQIEWEYATEVERISPLIESVKATMSLTDEQIDDMFLSASKL